MTNKRNTEMAKKVAILGLFGLLVIIIIGIALAVYFGIKKSDDGETSDKPEFTFNDTAKIKYNKEESSGSQEGYRIIEYLGSDLDRSKLIDITLSWQTGIGFDSVNKIIFTRHVGTTKIQDNIEITKDEFPDMLKDYSTGSVTFKGSDVKANAKGTNVIKAYWNEVNESKILATAERDITDDDFSYTADGPFGEYEVTIAIVSGTFKLDMIAKKIYYNLSFIPDKWYRLQINNSGTYSFKSIDNTETLTFDGQTKFKLKKYKGKNLLIHPTEDDQVLVYGYYSKEFKSESDMTREDWGFASFTLTAATTITPGAKEVEDIKQGIVYKSPNGKYSLEFQDDGNLVLRKTQFNSIKWESKTDAQTEGSDSAKRIAVRPQPNYEKTSELIFTKTDDPILRSGNAIREDRSIKNTFTKPYTLILTDDGILAIIDKTGKDTQALDFIAKSEVELGDTFKCITDIFTGNDTVQAYRYIGYNQRNQYKSRDALNRMDAQGAKNIKLFEGECGNMKEGPKITDSVIADFPQLEYDETINLDIDKCSTNSTDINKLKSECHKHASCGGLAKNGNCFYTYKGLGSAWPEGSDDDYDGGLFNFNLFDTNRHYLFRM
jgi:hypothetical protein